MPTTDDTRFVRFAVTRSEHRQLRLAAANQDTSTAAYVRQSALAVAAQELETLKPNDVIDEGKQPTRGTTKNTGRPR